MAAIDPDNPTDAELLTAVNAAIYDLVIKKFKSTTVNQRTYQRNELRDLYEFKAVIETRVNAAAANSGSVRLGDISGTGL